MSSSFAIAASGLQLATQQLDASAHNVANVLTDGFEPTTVVAEEVATGGVEGHVVPGRDAAFEARLDRNIAALSGTDLVHETVGQMAAAAAFRANLAVLRTADEVAGAVIDLKA